LGKEHHFPLVAPLDEEGYFVDGFNWLTGKHVSEVAQPIFDSLKQKGILYAVEPYTHRYPVCWRCDSELVFRLVDEWFISMGETYDKPRESLAAEEKKRSLRYQIMDVVDQIKWIPARLDDQQEALLGAGAAYLGMCAMRALRGDRQPGRAAGARHLRVGCAG
jgi:isoleucyl-tRNA synthetase